MSRKLFLTSMPLIVAAGIGFFAYTSCDQLPDEKSNSDSAEKNDTDPVVTVAKGVVCDQLAEMESYPVQFAQKCTVEVACSETVMVPIAANGDTSTISVYIKETKEALAFSYDADKKAILIEKEKCPAPGTVFSVAYAGKTNEQLNNSTIDDANFSCTTTIGKSDPASISTGCKVKDACVEGGTYLIPLHTSFAPADGLVEYNRNDSKLPSVPLTYNSTKNEVTIPATLCSEKDLEFTLSYAGKAKETGCDDGDDCLDAPETSGEKTLYVHPCGNFDPVEQSCDSAGGYVDLAETTHKTCQELGLSAGDVCSPGLAKCVMTPPKACGNTPTVKAVSAYYLHCDDGPFENVNCPASERRLKKSIAYVSPEDLQHLKDQIDQLKLARYEYKDQSLSAGSQLGFIIDDHPDAEFISADGKRVNIYAYATALAAALQVQSKEIEQLRQDINLLKFR